MNDKYGNQSDKKYSKNKNNKIGKLNKHMSNAIWYFCMTLMMLGRICNLKINEWN